MNVNVLEVFMNVSNLISEPKGLGARPLFGTKRPADLHIQDSSPTLWLSSH